MDMAAMYFFSSPRFGVFSRRPLSLHESSSRRTGAAASSSVYSFKSSFGYQEQLEAHDMYRPAFCWRLRDSYATPGGCYGGSMQIGVKYDDVLWAPRVRIGTTTMRRGISVRVQSAEGHFLMSYVGWSKRWQSRRIFDQGGKNQFPLQRSPADTRLVSVKNEPQ